jgi:KAP family P-loop domain
LIGGDFETRKDFSQHFPVRWPVDVQTGTAVVDDPVTITLYDDRADEETRVAVSPALAGLFAYADDWARKQSENDPATLTFPSALAAMVAGDHALCRWLRLHLALRGSAPEAVTKGQTFRDLPLPVTRLTTSLSFRRALQQATGLAYGRTLEVKHLMAAYPVVKSYHAGDFLRLRIDRRAWCLALAEHLQRAEPPAETDEWIAYARLAPEVLLPRYRPDLPAGTDLLGVGREVEAFAMLIASARTSMPLSIGVFGAWGSGKSYFMTRVEERVAALARASGPGGPYLRHIAHVRFNAWHYSESDVVASLVDHIFRNLRFGPTESSLELARRRTKALGQVAAADAEWRELQSRTDAAEAEESRLREEWQRISAEQETAVRQTTADLSAAHATVSAAEIRLNEVLAAQEAAVAAARRVAPAGAALQLVADTILEEPRIAALDADVRRATREARWMGANRFTIGWGVAVVALTAVATPIAVRLGGSTAVTTLAGAIIAITPLASKAMGVLRELAEKGAAFQAAVVERAESAVTRIREQHRQLLDDQERSVKDARATVAALHERLNDAAAAAQLAEQALVGGGERRRQAAEQLANAGAAAASVRRQLDALTLGSLLGDTIQEAADTEVFRKRLGTLSYARGYFQRLSETMQAARLEAARNGGEAPVLERVVLYIDDLDRCPADRVRQVLQAVHLLLAFDLFACVVAVDPRWILECLEHSPGVIAPGGADRQRDLELDVLGGLTTPSDYLEKIFQIPLWLRPLPPERRAPLAATLLGRDFDSYDNGRDTSRPPVDPPHRERMDKEGAEAAGDAAGAEAAVHVPPEVRISAGEVEFLQTRVAPLLNGNARALKRFVNTYHLVKAALSEVEFDDFAPKTQSDDARRDSYRVCMAQLALLATDRRRAQLLATLIDGASPTPGFTLSAWLDDLDTRDAEDIHSIAADLRAVLLPPLESLLFVRFASWFERTRRYSFYL